LTKFAITAKSSRNMDAREATRLVKEYFEETNGPLGTVFFQVQSVEPDEEEDGSWVVRCSFFPGPHAQTRDYFCVRIRPDKTFARVERVGSDL